jgi:predicted PurR-regulated permease PerM
MASPIKKIQAADSLSTISNVLLSTFIISVLYIGRDLLIPLALAALLTFMLSPVVSRCQRWLGRIGAVLFVVAMMFVLTGIAGWILTRQAVDLATKLPNYKENISSKLHSIQLPSNGPFSKLSNTFGELKKDLPGASTPSSTHKSGAASNKIMVPQQVEIVNGPDKRLELIQVILAPVLGPLGTAALVLLLLVFMLLEREDLRNRLIRLIGQSRISVTSRAMDDAGSRVSKYLQMQLIVNCTYGIAVAAGLYFIGVPNALLWGALATVLRFIPYIGPWIAATFPILLSLAISPSWMTPLFTIGLFAVIELISNNLMEPWLYGSSTGVTPIALIVAALAWTWLWGPVGLVLATPLTVCLVVMGRHIPRLAFLSIVLSDEEPLTPAEDCYHRLYRSGERDEMELVDNYLKQNSLGNLFDTVLIPVIAAAESDHRAGRLESDQLEFIEAGLQEILEDLDLRSDSKLPVQDEDSYKVCCIPSRGYRDQLAGEMVVQLLRDVGILASCSSAKLVSTEMIEWIRKTAPDIVCISTIHPSTHSNVRYLCRKLRMDFPKLPIIVGMWEQVISDKTSTLLMDAGADEIVTNTVQAAERIRARTPILSVKS